MSRMQAEPPPDRNQPELSIADVLLMGPSAMAGDAMDEFGGMVPLNQFFHASGGYGMPPGPRAAGRARVQMPRPQTGHVIRFPVDQPVDMPQPAAFEEDVHGMVHRVASEEGPITEEEQRTLIAMSAIPAEAVYALLNVPDVPLQQWHVVRQLAQQERHPRRQPRQQHARLQPAPRRASSGARRSLRTR